MRHINIPNVFFGEELYENREQFKREIGSTNRPWDLERSLFFKDAVPYSVA